MLWGAGSAIGEIPPYLITYSAASAGQESQQLERLRRADPQSEGEEEGSGVAAASGAATSGLINNRRSSSGDAAQRGGGGGGGGGSVIWRLWRRCIAAWESWMMAFIKERGFVGIFLLASWPNAAFDLCGMCCGAWLGVWEEGTCGSLSAGISHLSACISHLSACTPFTSPLPLPPCLHPGAYLMPFWTFFLATLLGKGVVKVGGEGGRPCL